MFRLHWQPKGPAGSFVASLPVNGPSFPGKIVSLDQALEKRPSLTHLAELSL